MEPRGLRPVGGPNEACSVTRRIAAPRADLRTISTAHALWIDGRFRCRAELRPSAEARQIQQLVTTRRPPPAVDENSEDQPSVQVLLENGVIFTIPIHHVHLEPRVIEARRVRDALVAEQRSDVASELSARSYSHLFCGSGSTPESVNRRSSADRASSDNESIHRTARRPPDGGTSRTRSTCGTAMACTPSTCRASESKARRVAAATEVSSSS